MYPKIETKVSRTKTAVWKNFSRSSLAPQNDFDYSKKLVQDFELFWTNLELTKKKIQIHLKFKNSKTQRQNER